MGRTGLKVNKLGLGGIPIQRVSEEQAAETVCYAVEKGIDFIDWAHSNITAETIDLVHARSMELHVWTVNDAARMQTLIDSGIDGITTDNPALTRQLLEQ